ncbi:MAG: hypothetical protein ACR2NX_00370 [Chthoniobacterales bacterium]
MSDQVKIGGDSKELIQAIDAAEARFARFDAAVNKSDFGGFEKRGRSVFDATTQSIDTSSLAVRRATVDWGKLAEERKRAGAFIGGEGKALKQYLPARPGQYPDPLARANPSIDRFISNRATVKRGLSELAVGLAQGGNAADVLAMSIHRAGFALKGGLLIGAAAVVGGAVIQKITKDLEETKKAYKDLERSSARPLSLLIALEPSDIGSEIETVTAKVEALKQKTANPIMRAIRKAAIEGAPDTYDTSRLKVVKADHVVPEEKAMRDAQKRLHKLSEARANKELELVGIKRTGIRLSQRDAEIQKINLAEQEKIAKLHLERSLTKPGRSALDNFKSDTAIRQQAKLEREEANRKHDLVADQLELETAIARLHKPSDVGGQVLTADDERLAILTKEADETERQLKAAVGLNAEEKARRTAAFEKAKNALGALRARGFFSRRLSHTKITVTLHPPQRQRGRANRPRDFSLALAPVRAVGSFSCCGTAHAN